MNLVRGELMTAQRTGPGLVNLALEELTAGLGRFRAFNNFQGRSRELERVGHAGFKYRLGRAQRPVKFSGDNGA